MLVGGQTPSDRGPSSFVLGETTLNGLDLVGGGLESSGSARSRLVPSLSASTPPTTLLSWLCGSQKTKGGRSLMEAWLRCPLISSDSIHFRLDLVELFVNQGALRQQMQEFLAGQSGGDLKAILLRVEASTANLDHVCRLFIAVETCLAMVRELALAAATASTTTKTPNPTTGANCAQSSIPSSVNGWLAPIYDCEDKLKHFLNFMDTLLDIETIKSNGQLENLRIKPSFSPHMKQFQDELTKLSEEMTKHRKQEESEYDLRDGSLKLEKNETLGYFFRVTLKDEKKIRSHHGVRILESLKSGVKFRTKELDRLNNLTTKIHQEQVKEVKLILEEVNRLTQGYGKECFHRVEAFLSTVDCVVSFANISSSAPLPFVRPNVSDTCDCIRLDHIRHPLLERVDGMHYIANSMTLTKEKGFCILTGPNMGGKSTFLKSIGVVVLLAQMGCFVPCSFAQIYPVDNILVRIGAGDNQSEGISTFMNEMINMKEILDVASQRSLILVDELGRGTSTQDGFGLAWAISEHIATRLMAPCVIATHFHELCSLSDIHSSSFNMHCTALIQDQRFLLLYKIKHGKSSQSYGIQIAELAQFPTEVISKAKSYLRDFEQEPSECNEIYSRVKSRRNV